MDLGDGSFSASVQVAIRRLSRVTSISVIRNIPLVESDDKVRQCGTCGTSKRGRASRRNLRRVIKQLPGLFAAASDATAGGDGGLARLYPSDVEWIRSVSRRRSPNYQGCSVFISPVHSKMIHGDGRILRLASDRLRRTTHSKRTTAFQPGTPIGWNWIVSTRSGLNMQTVRGRRIEEFRPLAPALATANKKTWRNLIVGRKSPGL